jgi:hypothetical protein
MLHEGSSVQKSFFSFFYFVVSIITPVIQIPKQLRKRKNRKKKDKNEKEKERKMKKNKPLLFSGRSLRLKGINSKRYDPFQVSLFLCVSLSFDVRRLIEARPRWRRRRLGPRNRSQAAPLLLPSTAATPPIRPRPSPRQPPLSRRTRLRLGLQPPKPRLGPTRRASRRGRDLQPRCWE